MSNESETVSNGIACWHEPVYKKKLQAALICSFWETFDGIFMGNMDKQGSSRIVSFGYL